MVFLVDCIYEKVCKSSVFERHLSTEKKLVGGNLKRLAELSKLARSGQVSSRLVGLDGRH